MEERLIDLSLRQYLDNGKTPKPNPGGGSVAAYVGGIGTALAIMALNLSYGKDEYESKDRAIKIELEDLKAEYDEIIESLAFYVDEDSKSFGQALEAFKLPKETEEEKAIRSEAIQEGYKYALSVPLDTARLGSRVLSNLEVFSSHCSPVAISDVGCAILFVASSIEAALQNVLINLKSIKDQDFVRNTKREVEEITENARRNRDDFMEIIYRRIEEEA